MALLEIKPGAEVGKALDFLMELRMEHGPLGKEQAEKELMQWWVNRDRSRRPIADN
jgi:poly(A) polymerase